MEVQERRVRVTMLLASPILFDGRVQREARTLRDAGYAVRIVCVEDARFDGGLQDVAGRWAEYDALMSGVETQAIRLWSRRLRLLPAPLAKIIRAVEFGVRFGWKVLSRPSDIYHCHDLHPGFIGILGRWIHRARLIYDAHELEPTGTPIVRVLKRVYESMLVQWSDDVITVSAPIAEIMQRRYGRSITVIENRPLRPEPTPDGGKLRRAGGFAPDDRLLLYVGYVEPNRRGIEPLIEAMNRLDSSIKFAILAVGFLEPFRQHIQSHIGKAGVDPARVRFLEPVAPDQVIEYLTGADLSVMLIPPQRDSYIFCAPNKLFQSIIAGVPVLASDNRTFPQYLYENGVGSVGETVSADDPEAIARRIEEMLQPENQATYRRNAELLSGSMDWTGEGEKLVDLYGRRQPSNGATGRRPVDPRNRLV